MHRRLRLRFFLITWGLLVLLLTALIAGVGVFLYRSEVNDAEDALQTVLSSFHEYGSKPDFAEVNREMAAIRMSETGEPFEVSLHRMLLSDEEVRRISAIAAARTDQAMGRISTGEREYRYLYSKKPNEIHLVIADREAEIDLLQDLKGYFVLYGILGMVLLLGVSVLLTRWATKPIAEAWEKQNDFVSDATHELKTPLAVIGANTEAVLANPDASVASQARWLGSIRGETTRMAGLVGDLLFIAKVDAGEIPLHIETLRISELIEGLCMEWEPEIFERERRFDYAISPGMLYRGDWERLRQMLSAMLDNAVKYAPQNGEIRLVANRSRKKQLQIVISNMGEPLAEDQLEKIFDRFYRVDPSRARETGGYGLGLCIARSIAAMHNGTITAESDGGINVFTVVLGSLEDEVAN